MKYTRWMQRKDNWLLVAAVLVIAGLWAWTLGGCERPADPSDYDHLQYPNQPAPADTFGPHMPTELGLGDLIGTQIVGFSQLPVTGSHRQWDLKGMYLDNGLVLALDLQVLPGKGNQTIIAARVLRSRRLVSEPPADTLEQPSRVDTFHWERATKWTDVR